jgi:hypothetical protein
MTAISITTSPQAVSTASADLNALDELAKTRKIGKEISD